MTAATATGAPARPEIVELVPRPAAIVHIEATIEDYPRLLGEAFRDTAMAITAAGAVIAGHPFSRYLEFGGTVVAESGFPFAGSVHGDDRVRVVTLPGGRAVKAVHTGAYDTIGETWEPALAWMREEGLEQVGPPWECYLTAPGEPGPPVTEVYWPIA